MHGSTRPQRAIAAAELNSPDYLSNQINGLRSIGQKPSSSVTWSPRASRQWARDSVHDERPQEHRLAPDAVHKNIKRDA
jgi:hypothetical protein